MGHVPVQKYSSPAAVIKSRKAHIFFSCNTQKLPVGLINISYAHAPKPHPVWLFQPLPALQNIRKNLPLRQFSLTSCIRCDHNVICILKLISNIIELPFPVRAQDQLIL